MRAAAFLIVLLALFPLVHAITVSEPQLVKSMDVEVVESGTISASIGEMRELEVNTTIPQQSAYQTITYDVRTVKDADGNLLANIRESAPPNPYRYEIRGRGSVRERITGSLPPSYTIPSEYTRYALPSEKVQSSDPEIRRIAEEVTANSSDDWERVARLAVYVNAIMTYDEGMTGEKKDARWVLGNRRGVCVEYATLFVAMARSLGIPARFVSGYAFSRQGKWLGHSWAEVYLGEWVPVDPTWLEAGNIDATHVETFRSASTGPEGNVIAMITPGAQLEWIRNEPLGSETEAVRVSNLAYNERVRNYTLLSGDAELGFGDETVVVARIQGWDYRIVELNLFPCTGGGNPVQMEGETSRIAIMRPGKEQIVVWRARANPSLQPGYVYTCPLMMNSDYMEERTFSLTVTPQRTRRQQFGAWLGKSSLLLGEGQTVYYDVRTTFGGNISLSGDDVYRTVPASGGVGNFTYIPAHVGINKIYVYSGGSVQELSFPVSAESVIGIANFSTPAFAIEGQTVPVTVRARGSGATAQSVRITVSVGSQSSSTQASLLGEQAFNFSIPVSGGGVQNVSILLEAPGVREEAHGTIEIRPRPSVSVANVSYAFVGSEPTVVLFLEAGGEPRAINISIDGRKVPAQPGEVGVNSPPGERLLRIEWADAAGNYYSMNQTLSVPERPLPATATPAPTSGGGGGPMCAGFVMLLFAVPVFALGTRRR